MNPSDPNWLLNPGNPASPLYAGNLCDCHCVVNDDMTPVYILLGLIGFVVALCIIERIVNRKK